MRDKVLVTGANGNLGKKFILSKGDFDICALVRSEKAKKDLTRFCLLYTSPSPRD